VRLRKACAPFAGSPKPPGRNNPAQVGVALSVVLESHSPCGTADVIPHEITPGKDVTGANAYSVGVTIDGHETVVTFFRSKEDAEAFAQIERARLTEKETKAEGT
jgi:hypothetical protein